MRALLRPKQLNLYILKKLSPKRNKLAPIEGEILDKLIGLINRILIVNHTAKSLKPTIKSLRHTLVKIRPTNY